jgi:hypothetical protein
MISKECGVPVADWVGNTLFALLTWALVPFFSVLSASLVREEPSLALESTILAS